MSAAHLAYIRTLPCCVIGCRRTPIEAHHIRTAANSGTGVKPDDRWAVPLCGGPDGHHMEFHRIGRHSFERKHKIDLMTEAAFLGAAGAMP